MQPDVSIIIVNWNSRDHLGKCLASIYSAPRRLRFEVLVIDSGSFDGADEMLREHYPQVRFIQSQTNLGFARANNRAAAAATGKVLLFLNPDTEILGTAIETLHAALTTLADAGVVGGTLLNSDGTVQTSCIQPMPTLANQLLGSEALMARWPKSRLWGRAALYATGDEAREVEGISGACLMIQRATFENVGGFSEDYFMYAEDVDLSHKVRRQGRRNYYVRDAIVVHHGGCSSGQAVSAFAAVMMREAIHRFFMKTRGRAYSVAYRVGMLASAAGRLGAIAVSGLAGRRDALAGARRKWRAVLLWSINRDGIVSRYYS
jgi:GT2 family glycosyltransferase